MDCMRDYIDTVYLFDELRKNDAGLRKAYLKFRREWEATRRFYEDAGMSRGAIATMFAYDLNMWLKDTEYHYRNLSLEDFSEIL